MQELSQEARGPLERLRTALQADAPGGTLAIAYSGGLDSRFLSHASRLLGFSPVLFHVTGPHSGGDEGEGLEWAREEGFEVRVIRLDPLSVPEVRAGSRFRCYGCKKAVFTALLKASAGLPLCDGTNHTDQLPGVWRPGERALKELGIRSPLAEARFGKPEIRLVARATGMARPDQLPEPCLLTRLPYGMTPTADVLGKLRLAETAVRRTLARSGMDAMVYRIRLVAPGKPEIHFALSAWAKLSPAVRAEVRDAVLATDPAFFRGLELRGLEQLSGYFDRVSGTASGRAK